MLVVAAVLGNTIKLLRIFIKQPDLLLFSSQEWKDGLVQQSAVEVLK